MRFSFTVGNYNRVRFDTKTVWRHIYNRQAYIKRGEGEGITRGEEKGITWAVRLETRTLVD